LAHEQHQHASPITWLDRTGIALSALCTVHCLALPLVVIALPVSRDAVSAFAGPWVHDVLGIVLPLIAGVALLAGFRKHGKLLPSLLGMIGIITLWVAIFEVAAACGLHPHPETNAVAVGWGLNAWITTVGSVLLVTAHIMNIRSSCPGCACKHEPHAHQTPIASPTPSTRSA